MRHLLLITMLAGVCLATPAQPAMPPGVRGADSGLATRSVSTYLGLERGLLEALKIGDRTAVLQTLGEDFEFRSATEIDDETAAQWLDDELRSPIETANVRNLSVREQGELAVVSFLLDSRRTTKPKATSSTLYVVDVWRQNPPQLLARYAAQPRRAPPIPTRPTGRE
jgi:hypothetical protein